MPGGWDTVSHEIVDDGDLIGTLADYGIEVLPDLQRSAVRFPRGPLASGPAVARNPALAGTGQSPAGPRVAVGWRPSDVEERPPRAGCEAAVGVELFEL